MSEFFSSLKSDLLDRRFLPVLAVLGVALLAALAYAVLGARSSTSSTPPTSSSASAGAREATGAIAISQAPAPNQAVAETTSGSHQHTSAPHNPFTPLPGAKKASSTSGSSAAAKSSSSSATSSSGSGKSTSNSGGTTPATTLKPIAPVKRVVIHFHVTAQFGVVPVVAEGAPPQPALLQTYKDMAIDEPLPGKDNPQLVYLGVVLKTGKDAVFGLIGEAILHGSATCKPSPTQCQAIELGIGQTEKLEVLGATGQPVTYELKLLSIAKSVSSTASTARARAASGARSKAGRALLRHAGLSALPGLRYSFQRGGLVPVGHRAFGARRSSRHH
ncbi:MAG TPA: hypothetical protein VNY31_07325 [Solirubrobacteraceae bacterium]|jgi:hypothetical protein|nr:hypothetical protein [Solirubrobacteraceae bacterium]